MLDKSKLNRSKTEPNKPKGFPYYVAREKKQTSEDGFGSQNLVSNMGFRRLLPGMSKQIGYGLRKYI